MPGYQDFEVGAGYINAYAAVDKDYNRAKNLENFSDPTLNGHASVRNARRFSLFI